MTFHLIADQYYWIYDSHDSYFPAKLVSEEIGGHDEYQFQHYETNSIMWIKKSSVAGLIPAPGPITLKTWYEDLVNAVDISEASILWNLHQRYNIQKIYSSIGTILIALNPYKYITELYNEETMVSIMRRGWNTKIPPHIWAIADASFSQLKSTFKRQAIVISGESGAGKTETTKKCLQYLSAAASDTGGSLIESNGEMGIEDRVLGSNPILESFGNSKTCRNDNSSRFGKWLEINFSFKHGSTKLIGANITEYLLEKSRVVSMLM